MDERMAQSVGDLTSAFEVVEKWERAAPYAPAFLRPGREPLTFRRLLNRVREIEGLVSAAGIPQGTIVAVAIPDSAELVITQMALSRNWACAPLNPTLTSDEFLASLLNLRPSALLAAPSVHVAMESADAAGMDTFTARSDNSSESGFDLIIRAVKKVETVQRLCSDVSLIFHTSGTTGSPKLVPLTTRNCLVRAAEYITRTGLTSADRLLHMSPAFLHQGWISAFAQTVAGGSVVFTKGFSPDQFPQWLEEFQPTWYGASPAVHSAIVASMSSQGSRLAPIGTLRFVRSSGAPLTSDLIALIEKVLGVPVLEGYGSTETGSIASTPPSPRQRKQGSPGISAGVEISIRDERGLENPHFKTGEITVRGPGVVTAYCGEEKTNNTNEGWFRTGDLGYLDDDGYLFVTGRVSERINRGGEKVMPLEVDAVLSAHPAVAQSATFGLPHPTLGEDVATAVVLKVGAKSSEAELRDFAARSLSAYKIPRQILFLDCLPMSVNGKVKTDELRDHINGPVGPFGSAASLPIPAPLTVIWRRFLNTSDVRPDGNFFQLGGDSLRLIALLSEVDNHFRTGICHSAIADFLAIPTLATLARIIAEADPTPGKAELPLKHVIALRPEGSRIPLFLIPPAEDDPLCFRHLADQFDDEQPLFIINTAAMPGSRKFGSVEMSAARASDAIQRVRPSGPCIVGGHCYGGVVAFETARRLSSGDTFVVFVALFDTPAPGYPKVLRHWRSYFAGIRSYLRRANQHKRFSVAARAHFKHLFRLARRKALTQLEANFLAPPIIKNIHSFIANPTTVGQPCAYEVQPIDVPVVQFFARDVDADATVLEDARFAWRGFARAGFHKRCVPGTHASMLTPPFSLELACQLKQVLCELSADTPIRPKPRATAR